MKSIIGEKRFELKRFYWKQQKKSDELQGFGQAEPFYQQQILWKS